MSRAVLVAWFVHTNPVYRDTHLCVCVGGGGMLQSMFWDVSVLFFFAISRSCCLPYHPPP